jgi:tetratricopeptide (TPR) repeat protein
MDLKLIPEAVRIDVAKALAQKAMKKLPEDWAKAGTQVKPAKLSAAIHYLDVSIAIYSDSAVVKSRAQCAKKLNASAPKKVQAANGVDLQSMPEQIRYEIGSTITMRGMRKLPTDWVHEKYGVGPEKLQTAVHYLDVAVAFERDLTAMNWRAQCLKLLRRWDLALAAFQENLELAKQEGSEPHVDLAKKMIKHCKARKAEDPKPLVSKATEPVEDPEYCKVALAFVEALLKEDFKGARQLLAAPLKKSVSEKSLAKSYKDILPSAKSKVEDFDIIETMDDWPDKKPKDAGWVYVALNGRGFNEAVTMTLSGKPGELLIRDIEWGRP